MRPGFRIQTYRNSRPRTVALFGLGEGGRAAAGRIAERSAAAATDEPPNLVVLIHRSGDAVEPPPLPAETDPSITLIVLEGPGGRSAAADAGIRQLRAMADLCVTTSDEDFAFELVSNLAS